MIFKHQTEPEDLEFVVEVDLTPAQEAITTGPSDNWQPGYEASIDITGIWIEYSDEAGVKMKLMIPEPLYPAFGLDPDTIKEEVSEICERDPNPTTD